LGVTLFGYYNGGAVTERAEAYCFKPAMLNNKRRFGSSRFLSGEGFDEIS
jgi:hypothetical protein